MCFGKFYVLGLPRFLRDYMFSLLWILFCPSLAYRPSMWWMFYLVGATFWFYSFFFCFFAGGYFYGLLIMFNVFGGAKSYRFFQTNPFCQSLLSHLSEILLEGLNLSSYFLFAEFYFKLKTSLDF